MEYLALEKACAYGLCIDESDHDELAYEDECEFEGKTDARGCVSREFSLNRAVDLHPVAAA